NSRYRSYVIFSNIDNWLSRDFIIRKGIATNIPPQTRPNKLNPNAIEIMIALQPISINNEQNTIIEIFEVL
ncbi:hypothetical protein, partial [Vibrio metschnikovii]|uniref:hypothetical protein n=1 Tax=Vibrio metschnikovii TaxID=28172 RepID=UPI001C2F2529